MLRLGAAIFAILLASLPPVATAQEAEDREQLVAMAARVDALLAESWQQRKLSPAPAADDAEFLRRAWLDLTGTIPPAAEVRRFLADDAPDKRSRLVDDLLARPSHPAHLASRWRDMLLPPADDVEQVPTGSRIAFEYWMRDRFRRNLRYDNVVAELLTTRGDPNRVSPAFFYTAAELKPEELAARVSRVFLGMQIDCAQCHDHPFDQWKQQDFWGFAAFFSQVAGPSDMQQMQSSITDRPRGEVRLPDSDQVIAPAYLGGGKPRRGFGSRRTQLAVWLVSRDNPYFARATVNRVWGQLFGRGLIEPQDDLGPHNPPSHPELLDELTRYFVKSGFDLRQLYRTLANTRAYQRSSLQPPGEPPPPDSFAAMNLKHLSPEQLYDCLAIATRRRQSTFTRTGEFQVDADREAFLARFGRAGRNKSRYEIGIPQALSLMNGRETAAAVDLEQSGLLVALEAPYLGDDQRVEELFLSVLSRFPTDDERARIGKYVAEGGPRGQSRQALSDVLWALINSAEFVHNH